MSSLPGNFFHFFVPIGVITFHWSNLFFFFNITLFSVKSFSVGNCGVIFPWWRTCPTGFICWVCDGAFPSRRTCSVTVIVVVVHFLGAVLPTWFLDGQSVTVELLFLRVYAAGWYVGLGWRC